MPEVECDVFQSFDIYPNYYEGFTFGWLLKKEAVYTAPMTFTVQKSPTGFNAWQDLSEEGVTGVTWTQACKQRLNKNDNLFYRIRGIDADDKECFSPVKTALGDLDLKAYAYAKEIMRKEYLQMRGLAGIEVELYKKMHDGIDCLECRDPITKQIMDPTCEECNGTGFITGWHGPFTTFATFSVRKIHKKQAQDGDFTEDDRLHQVRLLGSPAMLRGDMIVDTTNNLRYTVNVINNLTELRRIAVIQDVAVSEIETSDVKYHVGIQ